MNSPSSPLRWGILSTGRIAGVFAQGVALSASGRVVAVGSRSLESAQKFAAAQGIARAHGSYEELLADPEVDAVYVATPHPQHAEWVIKAAEAGKHILCEKPMGLNHAEAMVMVQAARDHGVVLMEAFMYRCHPQTAKIAELVRSGALGTVGLVQATFSFKTDYNATSRLWANDAGGGGILDVGCYAVSMARLVAGAASQKPFLDPVAVTGAGVLHPESRADMYTAATLTFENNVIAQVSAGVGLNQDNVVRIYGSAGWLHVPSPWVMNREGGSSKLILHKAGAPAPEEVVIEGGPLYALEADAFAAAVRAGLRDVPQMSTDDTLGNLATLDQWRAAIGLTYEAEKPAAYTHTIARRTLRRRESAPMTYATIPGVALPVSRLVMGCDNQRTMPHAAAMWDDFFERGGNTFDTAWLYGGGLQERLLGQWMKNRGLRDDVVVIAKGGHTPHCTPEGITRQLHESLERLQTGRVDVYMMHRDNPEVPVGELVDVLNEHVSAGRIGIFGGSNWSIERTAAANRYAKRKGLQGFGVLSNNFSLARMVEAPWGGCISSSDEASRKWLKKTQLPLFAWSSQARGFFTDRAGRDKTSDAELVRCWYSEDNFARRERAVALAAKKGVSPIAIAAAYVLHQPFPTFALIGPRVIAETVNSLDCLGMKLSRQEVAWLNLEREKL
ncbi:aldo/keto reductase [Rariglobus hedericola]|uniref:Oxidoreductase n=1 Tax=Rariglobus hedericola TaxID=2597822 RepID=A0A556QGG4_9BACT|nr:aldo/keto reductase [Rariglobus hedericola]TSJ75725.1 oxidoreductase [Rariglobus hedericola]